MFSPDRDWGKGLKSWSSVTAVNHNAGGLSNAKCQKHDMVDYPISLVKNTDCNAE